MSLLLLASIQSLMRVDAHTCEVQWDTGSSDGRSKISLMFAVESEMRLWASKIDEYRMMAILLVRR